MKERKPTTALESRAFHECARIRSRGEGTIVVRWMPSRTWGLCPRIDDQHGEKAAFAPGCGYDKVSAVLASFLQWLPESPDQQFDISQSSGRGMGYFECSDSLLDPCLIPAVRRAGWKLTQTHNGKTEDVFHVARIPQPSPEAL